MRRVALGSILGLPGSRPALMVAVDAVAPDKAAVVAKFPPLLAHKGPCEADRLYVVPAVQLCNAIEMPGDQITQVKLFRRHCGLLVSSEERRVRRRWARRGGFV